MQNKKLRIVFSTSHNPYWNLAKEEYLLHFFENSSDKSPVLYFWRNERSVIIGRNQNPFAECNLDYMEKNNVSLARRKSGGGAVFHDLGNLNYSFIYKQGVYTHEEILETVLLALTENGINAILSGRNDIEVNDSKVSGVAYYNFGTTHLLHGCLLFKEKSKEMIKCLTPSSTKIEKRGIKSVRSRVTYLNHYNNVTYNSFEKTLIDVFMKRFSVAKIVYPKCNITEIRKLKKIYESPEWIYGDFRKETISLLQGNYNWGECKISYNETAEVVNILSIETDSMDPAIVEEIRYSIKVSNKIHEVKKYNEIMSDICTLITNKFGEKKWTMI